MGIFLQWASVGGKRELKEGMCPTLGVFSF